MASQRVERTVSLQLNCDIVPLIGFYYSSGNNTEWLTVEQIRELLKDIDLEK